MRPLRQGYLKRGSHRIFYQTYGNPQGHPWVFCHGGPGFHSVPESNLKGFDLNKDYVVLFDQRGCGRSKSAQPLNQNRTDLLVGDISALLKRLKLKQVSLVGSSWGTTLALCFAIRYPEQVKSLVLKGLFLARAQDISGPYVPHKSWSREQRHKYDISLAKLKSQFKLGHIFEGLKILRRRNADSIRFAKLWSAYELLLCSPGFQIFDFDKSFIQTALKIATMELHYFKNHCFLPANYIIRHRRRLQNIPLFLIHGAQDQVCPLTQVKALQKALPHAQVFVDPHGGHGSSRAMHRALVKMVNQARR